MHQARNGQNAARKPLFSALRLVFFLLVSFGLMSVSAARADSDSDDDGPIKLVVKSAFVELHYGPNKWSPIFDIAQRGETVEVLVRRIGWFRIKTADGSRGWVREEQMADSLVIPTPEAKSSPGR